MNFQINTDDTLTILMALKRMYLSYKRYFAEYPSMTEGLPTPKEIAESYNYFLEQIHMRGDLLMITPIK